MAFEPLISTRFRIPPPRPDVVTRPRLVSQLDEGLHLGHRLSLIAAPAGFGKTTLIGDWIGNGDRPVSWLTVDDSCNDFAIFFNYLIASLGQVDESLGRSALSHAQSRQYTDEQDLITSLINDLSESDNRLILILDDYHRITSFSVHDALSFLVENQPPSFHMVIGTREDPPLPLARLRARGQITEIRERSLRFTSEETAAFLGATMKLKLSPENIEALGKRTEGWITGLQLAGLALRNEDDASGFVAAFAGNERFIMDYLITEVIEGESDRVRSFLRDTSILERLSAPLCNALTGHQDGQEILDHLERANLFVVPLDRKREWFRYHQLFAEVLRLTLSKQELLDLHSLAMAWYEAHEESDQAVLHALAFAELSGNLDEAKRLIGEASLNDRFSGSLSQPLVEPLSERELEVLSLINQGHSNAEIAQQLFIAIGTVKRHINNIYGKLDVKSRTQAIVKARELRLLD